MRRILRTTVTVFFGVLCIAVVGSWVRSYFTFDRAAGPLAGQGSLIFVSYEGRLTAVKVAFQFILHEWPGWDHGPVRSSERTVEDVIWCSPSLYGFGWISGEDCHNVPNGVPLAGYLPAGLSGPSYTARGTGIMIPHWFAALLLGLSSVLPWLKVPKTYQFSLRTLFIVTTLISILLGIIAWDNRPRSPGPETRSLRRLDNDNSRRAE
jgi:hypothetical protein